MKTRKNAKTAPLRPGAPMAGATFLLIVSFLTIVAHYRHHSPPESEMRIRHYELPFVILQNEGEIWASDGIDDTHRLSMEGLWQYATEWRVQERKLAVAVKAPAEMKFELIAPVLDQLHRVGAANLIYLVGESNLE